MKFAKSKFFTSWFIFGEGWLFGHFLGWWWAVMWMAGWYVFGLTLRAGFLLGAKSKETHDSA